MKFSLLVSLVVLSNFGFTADLNAVKCQPMNGYGFLLSSVKPGATAEVHKNKKRAEHGILKCSKPSDPDEVKRGALLECRSNVDDAGFIAILFKGKDNEHRLKLSAMAFDGTRVLAEMMCQEK